MHHDVLDLHGVENRRAGLACAEYKPRRHLYRIDGVIPVVVGDGRYAELVEDIRRIVLHGDLVEEHSAAPCPAAWRKLRLEHGDLEAGLRQIVRGDQTARACADDGDVYRQVVLQFLEIPPHYRAGYYLFHDGI